MKLPEFVYVAWNDSGNDGPWLDINKVAAKAIEDDGPTTVGHTSWSKPTSCQSAWYHKGRGSHA
jgi:hypothetical protein